MKVLEPKTALGIYSDSSAVYIDACILKTDGLDILEEPLTLTRTYSPELRDDILKLSYPKDFTDMNLLKSLDERITKEHLTVAEELINKTIRHVPHIDIIGYSGHSVRHHTADRLDIKLGNSDTIAKQLKIPVIDRFIQTDLKAGGTGGPVLPTFIEAITRGQPKPLGVISLSGISTVTFIGQLGELQAFDIGVGCLLLDRWLRRHAGFDMDFDGQWAAKGTVNQRLLDYLLKTPYLLQPPPKTLDRDDFNHLLEQVEGCSPADGAATLTAFIVQSIVQAQSFLPEKPVKWILTGGGTLNPTLILWLKKALGAETETITEADMPHYNLDAAGYAFLAVRSLMELPITFPNTTGVSEPISGGQYHSIPSDEESETSESADTENHPALPDLDF